MSRRDSEEDVKDAFELLPNHPGGWRGFASDVSGWEILRAFDRLGSSRNEADKIVLNAPIAISSVTSFLLIGWGLIALGSLTLPRAGYGGAALLGGVVLHRISLAFSRGARWALPVVAAVPLFIAAVLYWWLQPAYPLRGAADAAIWLAIAAFVVADASLLFGSVHPSWEAEPGE
ncbi:hypothetical protein [Haloferax sp. DFSO52]|uniref:hypothetical protein n=1 Tax=Haloferax sp. DFSO52 TaxID=3388505 RepID=UPI003A873F88